MEGRFLCKKGAVVQASLQDESGSRAESINVEEKEPQEEVNRVEACKEGVLMAKILKDQKYQKGGSLIGFAWYGKNKPKSLNNPYWRMELVKRPTGWFGRKVRRKK